MHIQHFRPARRRGGFTLVEIMVVVMIIGVLLNIAAPTFISAREASRAKSCVDNLKQLDLASQLYGFDNKLAASTALTTAQFTNLAPAYIRKFPACPENGTYAPGVSLTVSPTCSIPASNAGQTDYQVGGRYYHGL